MDEQARKKRCSIFDKATTYRAFELCDQDDYLKEVSLTTIFFLGLIVFIIVCIGLVILYYNVYVKIRLY